MPYSIRIDYPHQREQALKVVRACPEGSWVTVKKSKRTLPQNARMWAMLTPISLAVVWHGRKWPPEYWKAYFCDLLGIETDAMLDDFGRPIPMQHSTSDMSKDQLSDLMLLIEAFAARHGVDLGDAEEAA